MGSHLGDGRYNLRTALGGRAVTFMLTPSPLSCRRRYISVTNDVLCSGVRQGNFLRRGDFSSVNPWRQVR